MISGKDKEERGSGWTVMTEYSQGMEERDSPAMGQ